MDSVRYKRLEFFIIFILAPISLNLAFPKWIKLSIGILGFLYIIYVLLKVEKETFKIGKNLNWKQFWLQTSLRLLAIIVITSVFVYVTDKSLLFTVMLNKPGLWVFILFFYSVFSVYPQELIYRTFYFKRYKDLFKNQALFFFVNAILFSLAHLFFKNILVLVLTFLGGLLFAITYNRTKSTVLVSIEHAIYGCWLFTIGMGGMLGFPA